jgi:ABC-2 type transport system ATP-binding protein
VTIPGPPPPLPPAVAPEPVEARAPQDDKAELPPVPPLPPLDLPEPESDAQVASAAADVPTDTVDEAVVAESVVDETVVVEPVADETVVVEPVADEAVVAEPAADDPVIDQPVEDESSVEAPITEEPVADDSSVDVLVVDEPTDEVVAEDLFADADVVPEDDVAEPVAVVAPGALAEPVDAAAESPAPALALRGVVKQFGHTRAVDAIDLTIPTGSFFGLVGPNGAGKTTTLSMIAGLLRPDSGTIEVCGVDTATDPSRAKKLIGVLPDRLRTFDRLTGRQLLYYYGVLRGLSSSVVQSRIADLARAFDLVDALGRLVSDYSAGMTKKVMLAGAMIHSPRVLVLDEPFESLDPASSQVILDILETYVAHGGTVVLSSHGMALVERVCTRVAVLVEGEVLASGTVDEVRGDMTLEQRFVELSGGVDDAEGLEWLHTFSD